MAIAQVQRQTFEERLNRIQVGGGENMAGELHAGPREKVRARSRKAAKTKARPKTRQIKASEDTGAGPNSIMLPLGIFLGALSVAVGRLTEFQLFAADGLGQIVPPVPELATVGYFLFGGILALMFIWAFEMDSLIRRVAVVLGFVAGVMYEPMLIERIPDVYATLFSPGYVAEQIG